MKITIELASVEELQSFVDSFKSGAVGTPDNVPQEAPEVAEEQTEAPESVPAPAAEPAEPETKTYTIEDIRARVKVYTRSGRKDEIREILEKYDAGSAATLKPSDYEAFLKETENA